jgi:hypothetical protein
MNRITSGIHINAFIQHNDLFSLILLFFFHLTPPLIIKRFTQKNLRHTLVRRGISLICLSVDIRVLRSVEIRIRVHRRTRGHHANDARAYFFQVVINMAIKEPRFRHDIVIPAKAGIHGIWQLIDFTRGID